MAQNDRSEKHSKLFLELVISLQVSTLQFLGKIVSPQSGKAERNLQGAAASIDMLDMLAEKTKGNLQPDEARFLDQTLSHLKLNYVEEMNKPASQPSQPDADEPEAGEEAPPPPEDPGEKAES